MPIAGKGAEHRSGAGRCGVEQGASGELGGIAVEVRPALQHGVLAIGDGEVRRADPATEAFDVRAERAAGAIRSRSPWTTSTRADVATGRSAGESQGLSATTLVTSGRAADSSAALPPRE